MEMKPEYVHGDIQDMNTRVSYEMENLYIKHMYEDFFETKLTDEFMENLFYYVGKYEGEYHINILNFVKCLIKKDINVIFTDMLPEHVKESELCYYFTKIYNDISKFVDEMSLEYAQQTTDHILRTTEDLATVYIPLDVFSVKNKVKNDGWDFNFLIKYGILTNKI